MSKQLIATWRWLKTDGGHTFDGCNGPFKVLSFDSKKELETYCMKHWEYLDGVCTTIFPFNVIEVVKDSHEVTDQFNIYIERT